MPPPPEIRETITEYLDELPAAEQPTMTIAMGGAFSRLHIPGTPPPNEGRNRRGAIKRFTRSSRRRLMQRLASIDRRQVRKLPLFITLTYPATWPETRQETKRHLDTFFKALTRRWKDAATVWKLEYQGRGAPHYHLLVFNIPFIPAAWVAETWYRVVGSEDNRHLAAGTEVRRVRSWNGVAYYASKYLAKVGDDERAGEPGRYWGVSNSAKLPIELLVCCVSWQTAYRVRRVLRRRAAARGYTPGRAGRWTGAATFLDWEPALRLLNWAG